MQTNSMKNNNKQKKTVTFERQSYIPLIQMTTGGVTVNARNKFCVM